jgi:hypothetical protein
MKVRAPALFAVAALLLLAVLVASGRSGIQPGQLRALPSTESTPPPSLTLAPPDASSEPVAYGASILILLAAIGVLLATAMFLYALTTIRLRRRGKLAVSRILDDDTVDSNTPWLVQATRRAVSEMDRRLGGPPSDAVIAAWVDLEQSAAASGIEREPHQTSTEFTEAVLAAYATDSVALQELRALYQRARFGPADSVTAEDAEAARRALARIALETTS